jgi:steroid delta-isomerase-like uncharacterized protein
MGEPDAVRALRECVQDFNSHDPALVGRCFAEDGEHLVPALGATWQGREQRGEALGRLWLASPDIRIELTYVFGDGEQAAGEWVISGTSERPYGDLPATGRRFAVPGVTCVSLRGGRIRRQADYWDLATLLRQLGLMAPS